MIETTPSLLLTGATGYVGRRLAAGLSGPWRVFRASRTAAGEGALDLDLANPDSIRRAFDAVAPKVVIHAGAEADPDVCEKDPDRAKRVNVDAVKTLAMLCGASGTRLIHFSSDLVFDGERGWYTEDDVPNPGGVYARGKLASEEAALARAPGAVVLRISTAYGRPLGGRPSFVDGLRAKLSAGEPVSGFTDQWRTSTAADQLPKVTAKLLKDPDLEGLFHWGGSERATRFETAVTFARVMGFDERLVHPGRAVDMKFASPRPRDSSLDSSRLAAAIGVAPLGYEAGFKALRGALLAVLAFAAVAAAAPAALTLGARAERHVRESHFAEGRRSRGKSLFLPGTDLLKLLKAAERTKPRREPNGRDKRVTDAGVVIGSDGRSGKPVKTYVVVAELDGQVVTMYPGR